jgi:hypothetical protein
LWCRAEYRQRWVQHLTVALLIGFVGAAVFTCFAAARRTNSAYGRYLRAQSISELEAGLPAGADVGQMRRQVEAVEGVEAAGAYDALFVGPDRPDILPGQNFMVFAPLDDVYARTLDRLVVLEGRMPATGSPDEIIVNERAARNFGLAVGSTFKARSIGANEQAVMEAGDFANIRFKGPAPTLRVVGIGRARVDLTGSTYVSQYGFASPAFARTYDDMYGFGAQLAGRLRAPPDREAAQRAIASIIGTDMNDLDEAGSALQDTARIQSIALLLIGLTALLAGALVISQAIVRMIRVRRSDVLGLRELGVDRATAVRFQTVAFLPTAFSGVLLAAVGAWIASRWFPTGLIRRAEPHPGMRADILVFALGAGTVLAAVSLRVAIAAARLTETERSRPSRRVAWTDRIPNALGPTSGTGVRWAVGRAEGKRPLTGFLAAIVGVAGLVAVTTYTGQLDYVVATPSSYGNPADSGIEVGSDRDVLSQARDFALEQDSIADIADFGVVGDVSVNGRSMQGWAVTDQRGHIGPTVIDGRVPARDSEAMLGTRTAKELEVGIGDVVRLTGSTKQQPELTVVGTGLFPVAESDRIADGIVVTQAILDAVHPNDQALGITFNWKPDVDVTAETERFSLLEVELSPALVPPDVANMRVVRSYPWWLAGFLVVLAMLATTNALFAATRRRRHEMAVLGAIGLSRRQLEGAVATQGVVIGALAAIVGMPTGLLVGKWLWTVHADRIGLSSAISIPFGMALVVGAVTVALTCVIAVAAGWGAMRTRVATALRTE